MTFTHSLSLLLFFPSVIDILFVHNATGDYALVMNAPIKIPLGVNSPPLTFPIPVIVPNSCRYTIDEEPYCVLFNANDFIIANGMLLFNERMTLFKSSCPFQLRKQCDPVFRGDS